MLVVPMRMRLGMFWPFRRLWRRLRDLCDQESSGSLGDPINEDAEQRDLEEDKETNSEAKKDTFTVMKPCFLLLRGVSDAGKVRLELEVC